MSETAKEILELDYTFKVINNLIPKEFIEALIQDNRGDWTNLHTNSEGKKYINSSFRTDKAITITDAKTANKILAYIVPKLPKLYKCYSINPLLRFTKSEPGDTVAPHMDSTNGQEGYLSMIVYLSNNTNGATRFFNVDTMQKYDVLPKVGRVVIFDHRITHADLASTKDKYILRTNVNGFNKLSEIIKPVLVAPPMIRTRNVRHMRPGVKN